MRETLRWFWSTWGAALAYPAVLVLIGAVAIVATYCTGCGAGQYETHAFTALALRDSANAAKAVYREERKDHMRNAASRVVARGGTVQEIGDAIDDAAAEFDTAHADLREAHAAFAEASKEYTRLVFAALRGQGINTDEIVAAGRAAIIAYNHVATILRRHGLPEMPEIPPGTAEFLRVLLPDQPAQPQEEALQ